MCVEGEERTKRRERNIGSGEEKEKKEMKGRSDAVKERKRELERMGRRKRRGQVERKLIKKNEKTTNSW